MTSNTPSPSDPRTKFFREMLLPKLQEECPLSDWRIRGNHTPVWVNLHRFSLDLWIGVGFTQEHKLRIDLHIGGSIQERYPQLYPELCNRGSSIEEALGLKLIFTAPGTGGAKAARIEVERTATIGDIEDIKESKVILDWTVLNVISFRSAFTSHINELIS